MTETKHTFQHFYELIFNNPAFCTDLILDFIKHVNFHSILTGNVNFVNSTMLTMK